MDADCLDVGSTNPDIAGLGIVIAFAFQAGMSLVLSMWSLVLWKDAVVPLLDLNPLTRIMLQVIYERFPHKVEKMFGLVAPPDEGISHTDEGGTISFETLLKDFYKRHESWGRRKEHVDRILLTISDVQTVNGLSLLVAGLAQYKSLSLYHMHIIYDTINFTAVSICGGLVSIYGENKKSRHSRLYVFVTFIALYIAFLFVFAAKLISWDLTKSGQCYKYELISLPNHSHPTDDIIYVSITCSWCLFVLNCCGQLDSISVSKMSKIYQEFANNPSATIALTDKWEREFKNIFKAVMRILAKKWGAIWIWDDHLAHFVRTWRKFLENNAAGIVLAAILQYPVHLYMVIALRISNEGNLSGASENTWGFGQIVALVTAFSTVMECVRGYSDYCAETKEAVDTEEAGEVNAEARDRHEGSSNRRSTQAERQSSGPSPTE